MQIFTTFLKLFIYVGSPSLRLSLIKLLCLLLAIHNVGNSWVIIAYCHRLVLSRICVYLLESLFYIFWVSFRFLGFLKLIKILICFRFIDSWLNLLNFWINILKGFLKLSLNMVAIRMKTSTAFQILWAWTIYRVYWWETDH